MAQTGINPFPHDIPAAAKGRSRNYCSGDATNVKRARGKFLGASQIRFRPALRRQSIPRTLVFSKCGWHSVLRKHHRVK